MKRILRGLLGLILAVGVMSPIVDAEMQVKAFLGPSKGLLDHISPILRPDNYASAIVNLLLDDRGTLTQRNGYLNINSTPPTPGPVEGGGYHIANTGTSFFAVVIGTNVYNSGNTYGGTLTNVTGTVGITNSASNLAQSTSFNNFRVFCNESDPPFKVPATGGNASVLAGSPSIAKTCATFGNYLVVGNTVETGTTYTTRVRWSDINTTETWPANNYIDVETNDGDFIVSIVAFNNSIMILKRHAVYQMAITGLPGADAFVVQSVAKGIGCTAKMSLKVVNNPSMYHNAMLIFQAADGFYSATPWYGGLFFKKISDNTQNEFFNINPLKMTQSVAAVYPRRNQYWVAIATGTQTTNNEVMVYDYLQDAWTLYWGITANMLSTGEDSNNNTLLFSGGNDGYFYKQDVGTSDFPAAVSTAITSVFTTNDISLDSPDKTKNFKYLYIWDSANSAVTLNVQTFYDFATTSEATIVIPFGSIGALWNTAIWNTNVWPSVNYSTQRVELNRSARQIKLSFSQTSTSTKFGFQGFALVYTPETWRDSNDQ